MKVGMLESLFCGNSLAGLKLHHLEEKVDCGFIHVLAHLYDVCACVSFPHREGKFKLWEFANSLPSLISWGAHSSKDLENLTDFRVSIEEGTLVSHFIEDAAN